MPVSWRVPTVTLAVCAACVWSSVALAQGARDSDALLRIVDGQCVPDHLRQLERPPCVFVDLKERIAVIRDARGIAQHLLIATDSISGIEDPSLLTRAAENYFADAWEARKYVAD